MRTPRKATALLLTGGVALASVAYAIGSESGDGSAVADSPSAERAGLEFPGDRLADELGVEPSELRKALRDFHDQHATQRRDDFTAALADALGKPANEVRAALEGLAEQKRDRFARQLASELGIEVAKASAALEDLREDRPVKPFGFTAALAAKLGVDPADVEDALRALRPKPPVHRHHGREPLRELAGALDVTRAELREALRDLRAHGESKMKDHRADLVSFLAERFGVSEDKVEEALPEFPMPPDGPRRPQRMKRPNGDGPPPGMGPGTGPGLALPGEPSPDGISSPTATRMADVLARRGPSRASEDHTDRRSVLISLTDTAAPR
jgi:DNA-binding MarR family transcriptional regulator